MAVDEAILESVYTGESLPTLRLYAWEPACLSLGQVQAFAEVNTEALKLTGGMSSGAPPVDAPSCMWMNSPTP